ncbi:CAP domain-containing protein [Natrinema thermotolerans]|uniref:CAP domain-containing protein n=1 Tax=Natrinema thermotolerans TaxID=121872 RepID=A0AAF0SY81_9EURY|nr:CAP domain-containing protein [Natrinema thermotolerans]QCC59877.1 CAP domain-containing protein [Natrinema thermotolerans]WMT06871.1 CAP domain-containing protein [Natrinema thermotolerans]
MDGSRSDGTGHDRARRCDRALLRGLLSLLVAIALVVSLAVGTAVFAPQVTDGLGLGEGPAPSSEPPPAGERNPPVTDPDDPGTTRYETDVETITSPTVEDFVHAEINERRAEHGLEPLEWDGTAASVARAHTRDMGQRDYFAHTNPDGEGPYDRFRDVDDYCRAYGENIAMTWVDRRVERPTGGVVRYETAEALAIGLVDQWMNSTDHRRAILEEGETPTWDRAGVGVYIDEDGAVYAGQNFCREW